MRPIIALCLFAVAAAAPAITPEYVYKDTPLCHDSDYAAVPCETGHTTSVKIEQTDGQSKEEVETSGNEAIMNHGSYSLVGPDGVIYTVTYNVDSEDKPSQPAIETVKEPPSEPTTASVLENQTKQQDYFYTGQQGFPGQPGSPGTPGSPGQPGLPYYSVDVLKGLVG